MEDNAQGNDDKSGADETSAKGGQPVDPQAAVPPIPRSTKNPPAGHSDTEDPAVHQPQGQTTTSAETNKRIGPSENWMIALTAIIALATGANVWIFYLESEGTGRQIDKLSFKAGGIVDSMNKAISSNRDALTKAFEANMEAVKAAERQSKSTLDAARDMSRTDQRAWMDMIINAPPTFQEDRPFSASAEMKNLGKTPAKNIKFGYLFEGVLPSANPVFDDKRLGFVNSGMLPPQGPATLPIEITPGKPDELLGIGRFEAIRDGKIVVYYWGRINYDDVFGYPHWLQFCYIYNVPHRRFDLTSIHNDIDKENR